MSAKPKKILVQERFVNTVFSRHDVCNSFLISFFIPILILLEIFINHDTQKLKCLRFNRHCIENPLKSQLLLVATIIFPLGLIPPHLFPPRNPLIIPPGSPRHPLSMRFLSPFIPSCFGHLFGQIFTAPTDLHDRFASSRSDGVH